MLINTIPWERLAFAMVFKTKFQVLQVLLKHRVGLHNTQRFQIKNNLSPRLIRWENEVDSGFYDMPEITRDIHGSRIQKAALPLWHTVLWSMAHLFQLIELYKGSPATFFWHELLQRQWIKSTKGHHFLLVFKEAVSIKAVYVKFAQKSKLRNNVKD